MPHLVRARFDIDGELKMLQHFRGGRADRSDHHAIERFSKRLFTLHLLRHSDGVDRLVRTGKQQYILLASANRSDVLS